MPRKNKAMDRPILTLERPMSFLTTLVTTFVESNELTHAEGARKLIGHLRNVSFGDAVRLADSFTKQSYGEPLEHFRWNQLAAFVRKCPIKDPSLQPESDAWKKFLASEHLCRRTNQRLNAERRSGRRRHSFLRDAARRWIYDVIGRKPNLRQIYQSSGFGPGASIGVHGQATHIAAKLCAETWTSTPLCTVYARHAFKGEPLIWEELQDRSPFCIDPEVFDLQFDGRVKHVAANKIVMVPKTALVHRTIAIEPLLNGYIQKGIDVELRKKLKRVGIDLGDQDTNSYLAMRGSLGGLDPFSTIDLSSASDSISIGLCQELLPPEWFRLMDDVRSPSYESEWGSGRYQKFVSMGNGFCFPLETLIFASLAYAVNEVSFGSGDKTFRVYGDDIVVRQHAALLLIEVLHYLGFRTNTSKTFVVGPFRESCGADYFEGVNVRPYELDFVPSNSRELTKLANGLRENKYLFNPKVWDFVFHTIGEKARLLRPCEGPPDQSLTVPLKVYLESDQKHWSKDLQTWSWLSYLDTPVGDPRRTSAAITMYGALYGHSSRNGQPVLALRRRSRTRIGRTPNAEHGVN